MTIDVPSPIDLRLMADARPWAETALGFADVEAVLVKGGLVLHQAH